MELHAENLDGLLQPGAYGQVVFRLPSNPDVVRIPTSALLFREHGLQVATLGPRDKIELKSVKFGRNLGEYVEVVSGLSASDRSSTVPRIRWRPAIWCTWRADRPLRTPSHDKPMHWSPPVELDSPGAGTMPTWASLGRIRLNTKRRQFAFAALF